MIPLSDARARVLAGCRPLDPVTVSVGDAFGLVLAEPIVADEAIPPFANTAMDGFAVRSADLVGATTDQPTVLRVVDTLAAGAAPTRRVELGEAIRIMTGAPMPPGADAVIMVERTRLLAADTAPQVTAAAEVTADAEHVDADEVVACLDAVPPGNHVRPAGDDVKPGDRVFESGETLRAGHLGVLLSLGRETVRVVRRPRVGVISTGDELVEGSSPLEPGQIRDSNRRTLLSLVAELGATGIDLGLIPDDRAAIEAAFRHGAETCDAMISSGGVSMGDFDFVKAVLGEIADMTWMQVAIRPAKPLAFGTIGTTPIFGLPGNPVSSMVSFELFARPGLNTLFGRADLDRRRLLATSPGGIHRRPDGKTHFARVRLEDDDGTLCAVESGGQGSHQLAAMAHANALAIVPDGDGVPAGGQLWCIPLD